jgi:UDP-N-acetyl-D-mannosaminuronic acid transferase (WecB/TagA/CpsF family)
LGKKLTVFSQSGFEWLYRIYQEPRRMWKRYAKTNPVFVWNVVKEYVKLKVHSSKGKGQVE